MAVQVSCQQSRGCRLIRNLNGLHILHTSSHFHSRNIGMAYPNLGMNAAPAGVAIQQLPHQQAWVREDSSRSQVQQPEGGLRRTAPVAPSSLHTAHTAIVLEVAPLVLFGGVGDPASAPAAHSMDGGGRPTGGILPAPPAPRGSGGGGGVGGRGSAEGSELILQQQVLDRVLHLMARNLKKRRMARKLLIYSVQVKPVQTANPVHTVVCNRLMPLEMR